MKRPGSCLLIAVLAMATAPAGAAPVPADVPPLRLVQTIRMENIRADDQADYTPEQLAQQVQTTRMPNLKNHFDHFEVDLKRQRLFVVPEDNKTVEVYDLRTGELVQSIGGFGTPHSTLYRPDVDELFVTDGEPGSLKIFTGGDYRLLKEVKLLTDADSIGYDPATHYLYIDNGGLDAKLNYCMLSIVDTDTGRLVGNIKIDSNRIEAMALEKSGPRIFLNMTEKGEVGVIDREKRAVVATWPVTGGHVNVSIAFDEAHHRLFVACREGKLMVLDSDTGKVLETLPIATGVDDLVYDPVRHRIYVACGEGFVNVFEQLDADHYRSLGAVSSGPLGKTGRLVPELNKYFVAVPPHGKLPAEVLVYQVQ